MITQMPNIQRDVGVTEDEEDLSLSQTAIKVRRVTDGQSYNLQLHTAYKFTI